MITKAKIQITANVSGIDKHNAFAISKSRNPIEKHTSRTLFVNSEYQELKTNSYNKIYLDNVGSNDVYLSFDKINNHLFLKPHEKLLISVNYANQLFAKSTESVNSKIEITMLANPVNGINELITETGDYFVFENGDRILI